MVLLSVFSSETASHVMLHNLFDKIKSHKYRQGHTDKVMSQEPRARARSWGMIGVAGSDYRGVVSGFWRGFPRKHHFVERELAMSHFSEVEMMKPIRYSHAINLPIRLDLSRIR
jgi:hypothetical protein